MKKIKTETVKCNLCGSDDYQLLLKNYDRQHANPGIFNLVKCKDCGLVYLNPRPLNIGQYYPQTYKPYHLPQPTFPESLVTELISSDRYYKKNKNLLDQLLARIFEKIYSPVPLSYLGKVLDLGCGSGAQLYNLKKRGWDVYGLDVSEQAVKFIKNELGLKNVFVGTLEKKKYPKDFFEAVLLTHVIEHLPNPKKTLIEIKRILKPGGLLLMTTPNFASINARFFGSFWFPLETPRHFFLFTPSTLKKMLTSVGGLKVKQINHSLSAYSFKKTLDYLVGKKENVSQILERFKIIFLPLTILFSLIGRSDVFTCYVEKQKNS